ncbi:MAG: FIST N-terminal domain-containing protein [Pseudomonadota bacterium]
MRIDTFSSILRDTSAAFAAIGAEIDAAGVAPDFVFVATNVLHPAKAVRDALAKLSVRAAHGASSCLGTMTDAGDATQDGAGIALFAISDPDGDYGTSFQHIGADARAAAQAATQSALEAADRSGEIPDVVWVTATPGQEEGVLAGIEDVIGTDVPIIGGSAADNSVSGDWYVLSSVEAGGAAVVVSVLFPSTEVSFAYLNGYAPAGHQGTVTKVEGRKLIEIDHRPAMEVYDAWTDTVFDTPAEGDVRNILSAATLWPLGRAVSEVQGIAHYLLAHPALANGDGSMEMFADLTEGETITQMAGTSTALAERAGRVARQARPPAGRAIAGALMVYCGGCMLSIRDKMDIVLNGTEEALDGAPFLTHFSFGEQGKVVGGGNRHGNLMISCLVFSGTDRVGR